MVGYSMAAAFLLLSSSISRMNNCSAFQSIPPSIIHRTHYVSLLNNNQKQQQRQQQDQEHNHVTSYSTASAASTFNGGDENDNNKNDNEATSSSSSSSSSNNAESWAQFGTKAATYLESFSSTTTEENDVDEYEELMARKKQARQKAIQEKARNQSNLATYTITVPIVREEKTVKEALMTEESSSNELANTLGVTLVEVRNGTFLYDRTLDMDTLRFIVTKEQRYAYRSSFSSASSADAEMMIESLEDNAREVISDDFTGVIVSSVVKGGIAWNAGVRAGDSLLATSATMGEKLWPKSTLDGIQSAISSRRVMSSTISLQFSRSSSSSSSHIAASYVTEEFELSLPRPLGINVQDTQDGYVQITAFAPNANPTVTSTLKVGDRIVAVDSSLGNKMWPVSSVEGLSSACTSRLPNQPVKLRFERVVQVGEYDSDSVVTIVTTKQEGGGADEDTTVVKADGLAGAVDGYKKLKEDVSSSTSVVSSTTTTPSSSSSSSTKTIQANGSKTHKMLLTRCRDILRKYTSEHDTNSESTIPASVADRVLEAIADASAPLDAKTLGLIMNAYLKCRKPQGAIKAFEAAVGLAADGSSSSSTVDTTINGGTKNNNKESKIVPDIAALNLYTATSLLRAHALQGDCYAARRVLAAMEKQVDLQINGVSTADNWPVVVAVDSQSYNIALAAAAKAGGKKGMDMALEIFETMSEPGTNNGAAAGNNNKPEKNRVSYNTMLSMLAKVRRKQDAFTIFYSMKQAGVKPDKISYTALIKASVQSSDIEGARTLLSDMIEDGIAPDVVTYNTIIKGLCDRYRWFEAKSLVSEMESYGIQPDSMTYGLLMNGLIKANKPAACLTLFEAANADERTTALTENVRLYTTAITAASMLGDNERALGFIARMTQAGIQPNIKTFTALMSALISSDKTKLAVDVFNKIDEPDGVAMSLAIRAHCNAANFASAAALLTQQRDGFQEMSGRDVMKSYNYILRTSLQKEQFDVARNALTELLASGYIPSKETFNDILLGLDVLPKKKGKRALTAQKKDDGTDRFDFLLFVLDAINARKIACSGSFYATILVEGARLGGLRKKIASYLADAKAVTLGEANRIRVDECPVPEPEEVRLTWETLLERYSEFKNKLGDKCLLPNLRVRVGKNEVRSVLNAEQAVLYGSYRMRAARRFEI